MKTRPIHPDVTEAMWDKIDVVIDENKDTAGSVIGVLRMSQDVVGYLPVQLIDYIADGMNLPSSQVYGVATFYSLFTLKPKGRNVIKVCTGTACYVKGIKEVISHITNEHGIKEGETMADRRFSMEAVRCLGACGLAPVMIVSENIHGNLAPDEVVGILEKYN
jgi:NADH-quinone oxidoreductase subunit E